MKKVTSVTTFKTELGNMLVLTYSEINSEGDIIKRNARLQKVVVDDTANSLIEQLRDFAQTIIDKEEDN